MFENDHPPVLRYGSAVAAVGLATGLRITLGPMLGDLFPFATLFLAILAVAWFAGRGPALLSTALGAFAVFFFLLPPQNIGSVPWLQTQAGVALYLLVGVGIALLGGGMRSAKRRAERETEEVNRDLGRELDKFRSLFDVIPVAIAIADDPECRNVWGNAAMSRLHGLQPGANMSLTAPDGVPPALKIYQDGRELAINEYPLRIAVATGRTVRDVEQEIVVPDGRRLTFLQSAAPLRDEQGRIRGGLLAGVDITSLQQTQKALREAELRWRTLAETLPQLVWTDLPNGECDWLSSQWGKYTGIPENQLLGLRWLDAVVHPDDRERTLSCWTAACRDEADYDLEFRIRRFDGEYRWFKTRGVPIRDERGRIVYWFGTCTDIQDRKLAEQELREADRRKNEFLATLAHELRNPLAPIRTALHLLGHSDGDPEQREAERALAERQVVHLARLIDDLMDVARISRGKFELRKEAVDLIRVLNQAVETARPFILERKHHLTVALPAEPVWLDGDPTRLEQIFWNLLNNAAKYTEPGGRITLALERTESAVSVRVRDTGIGIAPEMASKVFDMFAQAEHRPALAQGGLGIGLNLVKTLVAMHGGSISLHSDGPGKGTEFVVTLPVSVRVPSAGPFEERPAPSATIPPRRRVLVVDDNTDAATSLARLLKRLWAQDVQVAHSGPDALALADSFHPEVVLLDIGLPGMTGYEVAQSLRRREPNGRTLIVALTGWGQDEDRRRSAESGIDLHLVKPVDPETLRELLLGSLQPQA